MTSTSATFHFCRATPPDEIFSAISECNALTNQQYGEVLDRVFSVTNNPDLAVELNSSLQHYADESELDLTSLKDIFKTLLIVCREATKSKLTPGQLYSDLQKLKMDANRASVFCQTWKKSLTASEGDDCSAAAMKRLVDMEWKFGVTASNSELHRVGNCYLQLKMIIAKGSKTENVLMELSLPQFYKFLHEMEKAKLDLETAS